MYQQKKPRNFRNVWIISMILVGIGIVLTINMALIRPLGFVLLGIGGLGVVWSLSNMDRWKDRDDRNNPRHFN